MTRNNATEEIVTFRVHLENRCVDIEATSPTDARERVEERYGKVRILKVKRLKGAK